MAKCSNCDSGQVYPDCPRCQGTGEVLGYDDQGQETLVVCPRCGGAGTVAEDCPACHGTGEV